MRDAVSRDGQMSDNPKQFLPLTIGQLQGV